MASDDSTFFTSWDLWIQLTFILMGLIVLVFTISLLKALYNRHRYFKYLVSETELLIEKQRSQIKDLRDQIADLEFRLNSIEPLYNSVPNGANLKELEEMARFEDELDDYFGKALLDREIVLYGQETPEFNPLTALPQPNRPSSSFSNSSHGIYATSNARHSARQSKVNLTIGTPRAHSRVVSRAPSVVGLDSTGLGNNVTMHSLSAAPGTSTLGSRSLMYPNPNQPSTHSLVSQMSMSPTLYPAPFYGVQSGISSSGNLSGNGHSSPFPVLNFSTPNDHGTFSPELAQGGYVATSPPAIPRPADFQNAQPHDRQNPSPPHRRSP